MRRVFISLSFVSEQTSEQHPFIVITAGRRLYCMEVRRPSEVASPEDIKKAGSLSLCSSTRRIHFIIISGLIHPREWIICHVYFNHGAKVSDWGRSKVQVLCSLFFVSEWSLFNHSLCVRPRRPDTLIIAFMPQLC